jgi:hypothetical protein
LRADNQFVKNNLLALTGAVAGGIVGYFGFFWLASQGFYALALPGALVGFGAGVVKNNSIVVAVLCGIAALALGIFTEFRFAPFVDDGSFSFFLTHLHQLTPVTWVMMVVGAAIGFYVPFRQRDAAA